MESVVSKLSVGLVRRGHSVRVVAVLSSGEKPQPFVASLTADGVTVVPLRVRDRDYLAEKGAIRTYCRQFRPDVVHTHGFRPDVVDAPVARAEGIPIVSTCHGFIESTLRGRIYQWLDRRALRRFDAVVAVSPNIVSVLKASGVAQHKIELVFNAFAQSGARLSRVEARRLLDLPDAPIIGWVGRLSAEKGPDIALEAFAQVERHDALLVILGEGREHAALRARADALGIGSRVILRGMVPDAGKLFPAFDVFLLSSRTEGTPMALLEAMAANVPIVATRVGGVPDVLDESSAWLVATLDSRGMAVALSEALSVPRLARERAERATMRLNEGFAIEPWLTRYENIYRAVLDAKRSNIR
jgi:glycosyltransferase involved in cell wall biosynthesis